MRHKKAGGFYVGKNAIGNWSYSLWDTSTMANNTIFGFIALVHHLQNKYLPWWNDKKHVVDVRIRQMLSHHTHTHTQTQPTIMHMVEFLVVSYSLNDSVSFLFWSCKNGSNMTKLMLAMPNYSTQHIRGKKEATANCTNKKGNKRKCQKYSNDINSSPLCLCMALSVGGRCVHPDDSFISQKCMCVFKPSLS